MHISEKLKANRIFSKKFQEVVSQAFQISILGVHLIRRSTLTWTEFWSNNLRAVREQFDSFTPLYYAYKETLVMRSGPIQYFFNEAQSSLNQPIKSPLPKFIDWNKP